MIQRESVAEALMNIFKNIKGRKVFETKIRISTQDAEVEFLDVETDNEITTFKVFDQLRYLFI